MKKYCKPNYLPLAALAAGLIGALLRLWLLSSGGENQLLENHHPANLLLTLLSLGLLLLLFFGTASLTHGSKYSYNFPPSLLRALGAAAAALGILVTGIQNLLAAADTLTTVSGISSLLAAGAMVFISLCRRNGKHPSVFFHSFVCLHLMVHMICQYRIWSVEPQIQTYCFHLLATVFLMLACYHSAMFDGNCGTRRAHTVMHLMAAFFCCLALVGDHTPGFYLTMGFWMFTDLCNLHPAVRRTKGETAQ